MGVPLGLSFCNSIPTWCSIMIELNPCSRWSCCRTPIPPLWLPQLIICQFCQGLQAVKEQLLFFCGCTVSAALGRRCFWKSLAWHAGSLFSVSCKSLIERIRRNLELAIAFRIFYASKRARSIIKWSNWFDENILPISLHNTPHPDPNTHSLSSAGQKWVGGVPVT
jgi:hypothetical protein